MQTLFALDFRGKLKAEAEEIEKFYQEVASSIYEIPKGKKDSFSRDLLFGVLKNLEKIDQVIDRATPD